MIASRKSCDYETALRMSSLGKDTKSEIGTGLQNIIIILTSLPLGLEEI